MPVSLLAAMKPMPGPSFKNKTAHTPIRLQAGQTLNEACVGPTRREWRQAAVKCFFGDRVAQVH